MQYPTVAIVILNYNGLHYLQQFLGLVVNSSYPNKRVIVADNASTDNSVQWLQQNHPHVERIILPTNYGFARGYNEALKQVNADYYILLNSDVEVPAGWIEPVIELMQADENIAACQPKILSYHHKHLFEYAGAAGGWIDSLGYPFSRGRVFDDCEEDKGQYDSIAPIFWASGAAFFVRSEVYNTLKGFDAFFFAHQEEIDLCWRMQLAGYKIMACPQSVVYHVGGGTLPKGERKAFLNFRNNLVMVYKNWTLAEKIWKLPLRMLLDIVSALQAAMKGDMPFCKGVCKAEITFMRWLVLHKKDRQTSATKSHQLTGVYHGSVVWEYFIKKKKTFTEIVLRSR
ncbi:glycosyltransferase [Aridibaculum aurantiacum]|uniref:glycosyltransferase n=1 Tax=Aridibaculum aurantiacum TaxID=2810307 RepID=UPI001A95FBC7